MESDDLATIAAIIGAVTSVASTGYSIYSSEKAGGIEAPAAPTDATAQNAAKAEAERLRKRRGFMSTIHTGMGGITEEPAGQKTTLGG